MSQLVRAQRGAVFILALPMTLFLIGVMHYAVGLGEAILAREVMQDAADASAFSAAVMMARGMNLVVLVNVVMATLMAVLVLLRLTQVMLGVGIGICVALTTITLGASAGFVAPLTAAKVGVEKAYLFARPVVTTSIRALYDVNRVLRYAMPIAAQVRVVDTSRQYAPPAFVGFAIPTQFPLPTEDGTPEQLCGKAAEYAGKVATLPIGWLLPDFVMEAIEDGLVSAAESLAVYFCSDGSGPVPSIEVPAGTVQQRLPKLPLTRECEDYVNTTGNVEPAHVRICDDAEAQVRNSEPHRATGACAQADCSDYELRAELARGECAPPGRPPFEQWTWQVRTVHLKAHPHYRGEYPVYVERLEPEYEEPVYRNTRHPPCGANGEVGREWNTEPSKPVCVEPHPELELDGPVRSGVTSEDELVLSVTYREVLRVFDCTRTVPRVSPHNGPIPGDLPPVVEPAGQSRCSGGTKQVHQNVKADALLGDETFQLRAVVIGEASPVKQRKVLDEVVLRERSSAAPWNASVNLGDALRRASHVFVAQAEYYFDADHEAGIGRERLEWMWTMDWRARLTRFRLAAPQSRGEPDNSQQSASPTPSSADRCGVAEAVADTATSCSEANGGGWCAAIDAALEGVSGLVIH